MIIGRPLPRSEDIEHMAAAITGQPVIAGPMVEQHRTILRGSLAGQIFKRRIYAVPEAEMVRQAVTEAAMVQAVGRARGVNRTEACPVEVFMILDDTVTELDVDEVVAFRRHRAGRHRPYDCPGAGERFLGSNHIRRRRRFV